MQAVQSVCYMSCCVVSMKRHVASASLPLAAFFSFTTNQLCIKFLRDSFPLKETYFQFSYNQQNYRKLRLHGIRFWMHSHQLVSCVPPPLQNVSNLNRLKDFQFIHPENILESLARECCYQNWSHLSHISSLATVSLNSKDQGLLSSLLNKQPVNQTNWRVNLTDRFHYKTCLPSS